MAWYVPASNEETNLRVVKGLILGGMPNVSSQGRQSFIHLVVYIALSIFQRPHYFVHGEPLLRH